MEILITRIKQGASSTLSELRLDGLILGYCLEDIDRGLSQDMTREAITAAKKRGTTAIPTGRYQVQVNYSQRFKRLLPIVLTVPGFSGIRIHPGNSHKDTEGCLLPGRSFTWTGSEYLMIQSRDMFNTLFANIQAAIMSKSQVYLTVETRYEDRGSVNA